MYFFGVLNNSLSILGTFSNVPATVNAAHNVDTIFTSTSVSAGIYLINTTAYFKSTSTTGIRNVSMNTGAFQRVPGNSTGDWAIVTVSDIYQATSSTTLQVKVQQNTGSTVEVTGSTRILRIK